MPRSKRNIENDDDRYVKRICKTRAKDEFMLTDGDVRWRSASRCMPYTPHIQLAKLAPPLLKTNPHYRSAAPMQLFPLNEVQVSIATSTHRQPAPRTLGGAASPSQVWVQDKV